MQREGWTQNTKASKDIVRCSEFEDQNIEYIQELDYHIMALAMKLDECKPILEDKKAIAGELVVSGESFLLKMSDKEFAHAVALDKLFRGEHAYISSTKSMTGHECWMAGASEVIYSMIMMKNGFIAPNVNFENPDEDSAKLNIPAERVEKQFDTFLSNSFGFGGTNSTLIIRNL